MRADLEVAVAAALPLHSVTTHLHTLQCPGELSSSLHKGDANHCPFRSVCTPCGVVVPMRDMGQHADMVSSLHSSKHGMAEAAPCLEFKVAARRDGDIQDPHITIRPLHCGRCIHVPVTQAGVATNDLVHLPVSHLPSPLGFEKLHKF